MPKGEPGYGWGYCPIAVDEDGEELGFAPLSCDVAEDGSRAGGRDRLLRAPERWAHQGTQQPDALQRGDLQHPDGRLRWAWTRPAGGLLLGYDSQ